MDQKRTASLTLTAAIVATSSTYAFGNDVVNPPLSTGPTAELHIARLVFQHSVSSSWGPGRPWWRIDWPEAEYHFTNGIRRYTAVDVEEDSVHLTLNDTALFDYPLLFAQQVGRWQINDDEAATLGEYLKRGGFLIVDDFHGPHQWQIFHNVISRALPGYEIVDIEFDESSLAIQFDVDQQTQIPGRRHVMGLSSEGEAIVNMPYSPQQWKGIYDEDDRLMVAINFNMDMGDAWEHADAAPLCRYKTIHFEELVSLTLTGSLTKQSMFNPMESHFSYLKLVFTTLLIAPLAACSSSSSPPDKALVWAACEDAAAQFDCSKLAVPMDHSQPDGEKIDIALIRHRATGTERQGSLFVNFGGASGRGVEDVQLIIDENIIPPPILAAYDIVGFDPRGAGDSTPVDCSDVAPLVDNIYPVNAEEIAQIHADYSQFSTACENKYGDYLQHLGSLNIVRDMEQIRIAMGDDKVNFLAYSFASRVAALFLQEFPESSGRMILDGSVSPDSSLRIVLEDPLALQQAALLSLLASCKNTNPDCDPDALATTLAARMTALAAEDTQASDEELELLIGLLIEFVEFPGDGLFFSADIVNYIETPDVSILNNITNELFGPPDEQDDAASEFEGDDGRTVETASLCADDAFRPSVDDLVSALTEFNNASDVFAEVSASEFGRCAAWPVPTEQLAPIVTNTAPQSIVIGGTNDPLAPLALSEDMAAAIGGTLIRSDHPGHISVFLGKSRCVDNLATAFLLDGTTPTFQECTR